MPNLREGELFVGLPCLRARAAVIDLNGDIDLPLRTGVNPTLVLPSLEGIGLREVVEPPRVGNTGMRGGIEPLGNLGALSLSTREA